jgi:hypothetical protein
VNQNGAISAGTNVTVDGASGLLDFNNYSANLHSLTLTNGAHATAAALQSPTVAVTSGLLNATSIVGDSLTIGSHSAAAKVAGSLRVPFADSGESLQIDTQFVPAANSSSIPEPIASERPAAVAPPAADVSLSDSSSSIVGDAFVSTSQVVSSAAGSESELPRQDPPVMRLLVNAASTAPQSSLDSPIIRRERLAGDEAIVALLNARPRVSDDASDSRKVRHLALQAIVAECESALADGREFARLTAGHARKQDRPTAKAVATRDLSGNILTDR